MTVVSERVTFVTPQGLLRFTWEPHDPEVPWVPAGWTAELNDQRIDEATAVELLTAIISDAEAKHRRALPGAA